METVKVFRSGNSQAVRLPKAFRFKSKEVEIFRRGEEVVLREKRQSLSDVFDKLAALPDDMWEGIRDNRLPENREDL